MYRPLADDIRPTTLDDVVGQKHILGPNGMLRRIVASGEIPNMVFYGPSGTGKTTVASIIAASTNRTLRRLNATTASISDIRNIIAELDTMLTPGGVLLYLLRNHRKAQVAVWALYSFLWDFVLVYLQLRGQPGFELSQMFTTYYEWFGVAAAVLMLAYNGMRGSGHKQLFYWFYPAHVYLLYGVSCLVYRLIA